MAFEKQNGAASLAHPVREIDQAGKRVNREHREKQANPQDKLIAIIAKSAREQFRVSIRDFNGVRKCEIRVYELDRAGNWAPTPKRLVIPHGSIPGITEACCEVEARL
jgi:hypothetical protein